MENKVVQVSIESFSLDKWGLLDGEEDSNLLAFSWIHPAENAERVEAARTFKNKKLPTNWRKDFAKSTLYKTPVRGKSQLRIEVSSFDVDSDAEKAFKELFKGILKSTLGVWTKGFSSEYSGAITKSAGSTLFDGIKEQKGIHKIGEATMEFDAQKIPTEPVTLKLKVKKKVSIKKIMRKKRPKGKRSVVEDQKLSIMPGTNGSITLSFVEI